jgi:hypothetical protein
MSDYLIDVGTTIDNGITGHIATVGGMNLGNGKWLLASSMGIEQLRLALMENRPDQFQIIELVDQLKLETLKVKWRCAGGATAPPPGDFTARVNTERWRLRE